MNTNDIPVLICSCGGEYPNQTDEGPSNFCPHCGRPSIITTMHGLINTNLANRRARTVTRRTLTRYKLFRV